MFMMNSNNEALAQNDKSDEMVIVKAVGACFAIIVVLTGFIVLFVCCCRDNMREWYEKRNKTGRTDPHCYTNVDQDLAHYMNTYDDNLIHGAAKPGQRQKPSQLLNISSIEEIDECLQNRTNESDDSAKMEAGGGGNEYDVPKSQLVKTMLEGDESKLHPDIPLNKQTKM